MTLLETICIVRREAHRLPYHQARIDTTLADLGGKQHAPGIDLERIALTLYDNIPLHDSRRWRWQLTYDTAGNHSSRLLPYTPRTIRQLQLLHADHLDYTHKHADRTELNHCFARRGNADDVLIVRHGWLTDTTIANIAFFDGTQWITPSHPLLHGTHRAALLDQGALIECPVAVTDLPHFSRCRLFNAMLVWGEIDLPATAILPA